MAPSCQPEGACEERGGAGEAAWAVRTTPPPTLASQRLSFLEVKAWGSPPPHLQFSLFCWNHSTPSLPAPLLAEDSPELVCTASGPWQEGEGVSTVGSYH